MRRRPNEIVLFDLKTGPMSISMFGEDAPTLIDPDEAINWIANGAFGDILGPRRWMEIAGDQLEELGSRLQARSELAEEMVMTAIQDGRIRCVIVSSDLEGHSRLSYVDPEEFKGKELYHEWNDRLSIQICVDVDDDDPIEFNSFWFFWDEVSAFAPRRPDGGGHHSIPASIPSVSSATPPASQQFGDRAISIVHSHSSESSKRRGRGRPAGKNGEPIAMFVLRVQAEGIDKLDPLADDALGAMLKEEYVRLGLNVPENSNAARDARGVIRALMKMQAKFDSQAAE